MPLDSQIKFNIAENLMEAIRLIEDADIKGGLCAGITQYAIRYGFLAEDIQPLISFLKFINQFGPGIAAKIKQKETHKQALTEFDQQFKKTCKIFAYLQDPVAHLETLKKIIAQKHPEQVIAIIDPEQANKPHAAARLDSYSGIYSRKELQQYLDILKQQICDYSNTHADGKFVPLNFELGCSDHVVVVRYNIETDQWLIINSDKMPVYPVAHKKMGKTLFRDLRQGENNNNAIEMGTIIYTTKQHQENLAKNFISSLKSNQYFKTLHTVTRQKAEIQTEEEKNSWLDIATFYGHADEVRVLLKFTINKDPVPVKDAAHNGFIDILKMLLLNTTTEQPNLSMLYNAIKYLSPTLRAVFINQLSTQELFQIIAGKQFIVKDILTQVDQYKDEPDVYRYLYIGVLRAFRVYRSEKQAVSCLSWFSDPVDTKSKLAEAFESALFKQPEKKAQQAVLGDSSLFHAHTLGRLYDNYFKP